MKRLFDEIGCYTDDAFIIQKSVHSMLDEFLREQAKLYDSHDLRSVICDAINLTLVVERIKLRTGDE